MFFLSVHFLPFDLSSIFAFETSNHSQVKKNILAFIMFFFNPAHIAKHPRNLSLINSQWLWQYCLYLPKVDI